ncbi:MAG: LysR family transcriptional regulator [Candidatus Didemnitutus sp.]|nr:LysR family transcriptional regulator [Candidatus Didemnitutus sp.]
MEIYQLRYFAAVAETGNFTKAASRSFISQPSLSQQILNLEEELGQTLFHRLGRKVSLTPAGELLLERAHRIIAEADDAVRELKEDPAQGHRVSVGVIPTVAHFFLPAILAYCRANEVKLHLQTREDFRPTVVQAVLDGDLELGVVPLPVNEPRIETSMLFSEPLLLAIAADHPLATAPNVTLEDLRDQDFIMLGTGSSTATQVQRLLGDHDFEPRVLHRVAQLSTAKALTALGVGISVLPRSARTANDPAGLVYRKFSGKVPMREIALIRHYRHHHTKGAKLFTDAAHAVVGPMQTAQAQTTPPFRTLGSTQS